MRRYVFQTKDSINATAEPLPPDAEICEPIWSGGADTYESDSYPSSQITSWVIDREANE